MHRVTLGSAGPPDDHGPYRRVDAFVAEDGSRGCLVEIICNTDYAADHESVGEFARFAAAQAADHVDDELTEVVEQRRADLSAYLGENITIGTICRLG